MRRRRPDARLVDELLEYARLGGSLRWSAVDLWRLLDELAEDQSTTGLLDGVHLDVGPLSTVRGDATEAFALLAQVHPPGTVAGGSGIGLATCRRIVNAHGGSIGISDGIDGGIAVWFTLPPT